MTFAVTDPTAPARKRWRAVDGIVLLDKPRGWSSTQALQRVRRLLQAAKAGHAGTLDPLATGMLPLCFGQATKACGALLGQRKAYVATIELGTATATGDREGAVTGSAAVPVFTGADLERVAVSLSGCRTQVPPMYSALKRDGQPLYALARRGLTVERAARRVTIDTLSLHRLDDDHRLRLELICSKGTYVRVLAEEVAGQLGTVGHLVDLRRLWVEPYEQRSMVTIEAIEAAADIESPVAGEPSWLLAADSAFGSLASVQLDAAQTLQLRQGRIVAGASGPEPCTVMRAYDPSGGFLGLVQLDERGDMRVQRLFVAGAGAGGSSAA